jgi:hypothetical protein
MGYLNQNRMKEQLEEASWKYNQLKKLDGEFIRHAFIEGAKWMLEQLQDFDTWKEFKDEEI